MVPMSEQTTCLQHGLAGEGTQTRRDGSLGDVMNRDTLMSQTPYFMREKFTLFCNIVFWGLL